MGSHCNCIDIKAREDNFEHFLAEKIYIKSRSSNTFKSIVKLYR